MGQREYVVRSSRGLESGYRAGYFALVDGFVRYSDSVYRRVLVGRPSQPIARALEKRVDHSPDIAEGSPSVNRQWVAPAEMKENACLKPMSKFRENFGKRTKSANQSKVSRKMS